jgi:hypothetical protein
MGIPESLFSVHEGILHATCIFHVRRTFHPLPEALDALHFLCEKYSLGLNFQKGDIQYINDLSISHSRDGFRDDELHSAHVSFWCQFPSW